MSKWSRDEKKAFTVLSVWSLGLILLITGANAFLIFNSFRNIERPKETRNLASTQGSIVLKGPKAPVLQWDCQLKKQPSRKTTQSTNARIRLHNCPPIKVLKNKSNQELAHVFPLENGSWTSDFIQLKEGPNTIQIEWEDKLQTLEITRQTPTPQAANKEL